MEAKCCTFQSLCSINGSGKLSGSVSILCVSFQISTGNEEILWYLFLYLIFLKGCLLIDVKCDTQAYAWLEKSPLTPGINQEHGEGWWKLVHALRSEK